MKKLKVILMLIILSFAIAGLFNNSNNFELLNSKVASINDAEGLRLAADSKVLKYNYGKKYGTLPTPTWQCHNFLGWFTEKNGGTQITENTIVESMTSFSLYAHWSAAHSYTNKRTTSTYLKSAATCTDAAVYYYSCANCTSKGTTTFTSGSTIAHSYTNKRTDSTYLKSAATCTSAAVYYYSCANCTSKGTTTFTYGSANGHSYTNTRTDSTYLKSAATCTDAAVYYYSCANCTAKGTTTFTSGSANGHSYTNKRTDSTYLKSAATCQSAAV